MEPTNYLSLDGRNSGRIVLGTAGNLDLLEEFTLEFWIYFEKISDRYDVILHSDSEIGFVLGLDSGKLNFGRDYANEGRTFDDVLFRNEWYHFSIYVGNENNKNRSVSINSDTQKDIKLDLRENDQICFGSSSTKSSIIGRIKGLRIWKGKVKELEVLKDFQFYHAPQLIAYWTLDQFGKIHKNIVEPQWIGYKPGEEETLEEDQVYLNEFITQTEQTINAARSQTESTGSQIGRIQMDLRVFPENEGQSISFPPAEQIANYPLSTLKLDFEPPVVQPKRAAKAYRVPDVRQLTEIHAARELNKRGFPYEFKYEATTEKAAIDRVIRQIPGPDETLAHQGKVTLFIGKKIFVTRNNA